MRSEKAGQNKEALRREALRRRHALPEEERRRAGERILQTLCSLAQYRNARRVLIYASFGDEVPTRELMRTALEEGKQVFCPRVEGAGKMSFYRIWQIGELTPGFRGILEPPLEEERKFRNPPKVISSSCPEPPLTGNAAGWAMGEAIMTAFFNQWRRQTL